MHTHARPLYRWLMALGIGLLIILPTGVRLHRWSVQHELPTETPRILLPPALLAELRPNMQRHGRTMQALTDAVIALDNQRVVQMAQSLLADPDLARPLTAPLGSLPPSFTELEDALQTHTRALLVAAESRDDDAVAQRHAELAVTCARCHSLFRP
jgi:hypothetical protein